MLEAIGNALRIPELRRKILFTLGLFLVFRIFAHIAVPGADKAALVAKAEAEKIANVRFLPIQPTSTLPALLNLVYATVIPLRRLDLFKAALPSKLFDSMAAGRPIVAPLWGEAAALVEAAACGLVVEPEDARAVQEAVEKLAADPALAQKLGEQGRRYVVEHFNRDDIAKRLIKLLEETARP